jgi:hypothetical protein
MTASTNHRATASAGDHKHIFSPERASRKKHKG